MIQVNDKRVAKNRCTMQAILGPAISDSYPFTDCLERCEKRWSDVLAGQRYENARLKPALYTYETSGLPAPGL